MSRKNIIFDDKKVKKSGFYKNKRLFKIDVSFLKKNLMIKKILFKHCIGLMMKMLLGQYI